MEPWSLYELGLRNLVSALRCAVVRLALPQSWDLDEEAVAQVRRYLEVAPARVLTDVLEDTVWIDEVGEKYALLPDHDHGAENQIQMYLFLRLALRPDVSRLRLAAAINDWGYDARLVRCIARQGAGLRLLVTLGGLTRGPGVDDALLEELFDSLAQLRDLTVRCASDQLLRAVFLRCRKLRKIYLKDGYGSISRVGLDAIAREEHVPVLQSLQTLQLCIGASDVLTPKDVAFLMKWLPNVRSVGDYVGTEKALLDLILEQMEGGGSASAVDAVTSKLEFARVHALEMSEVDLLLRLCPGLKSVWLSTSPPYASPSVPAGVLARIGRFTGLTSLKVTSFIREELVLVLREVGRGITRLVCTYGEYGEAPLDLTVVAALCPSLAELELYATPCSTSGVLSAPALHTVDIMGPSTRMNKRALLDVLRGSPSLRRLIVHCPDLEDGDVAEAVCPSPGVRLLEHLNLLFSRRITTKGVIALLEGCPRLRVLGSLSYCSISRAEKAALRHRYRNARIRLLPARDNEL